MGKLFLVQVKSESILREGKKALLIPMEMESEEVKANDKRDVHNALIRDAIKLYPQYTKIEDRPVFSISNLSKREYKKWKNTNVYVQKSIMGGE